MSINGAHCPFCKRIPRGDLLACNQYAAALHDEYPLSPGHSLVIPRRHVSDYFALSSEELAALWALVSELKVQIAKERAPDGFNIGINVGAAAGQTVWHAHVHLIPRYTGDVDDPRGGIRWLFPKKAAYWQDAK
jgi:diadenosine tetraphosphate (Ap4A) HIT family hydrolase